MTRSCRWSPQRGGAMTNTTWHKQALRRSLVGENFLNSNRKLLFCFLGVAVFNKKDENVSFGAEKRVRATTRAARRRRRRCFKVKCGQKSFWYMVVS